MAETKTKQKPSQDKKAADTAAKSPKKGSVKAKSADTKKQTAADNQPQLIAPNTSFTLTVSAQAVEKEREAALREAQKSVKIEGFRQGKVPLKIVAEKLGESRLREMIANRVLPEVYRSHIVENKLAPLTEPEVRFESAEDGSDWVFQVEIAEPPEVELKDYEKVVNKAKKSDSWKEAEKQDDAKEGEKVDARQRKVNTLLEALLETFPIQIPELLLRRETEHQLHEMTHQLEHMNMSLDDYLQKVGKSVQDIQQETAARSLMNLQVEFLLGGVVKAAKIEVKDDEIEAVLESVEKPTDEQRRYVLTTLLKQKAVDHLLTLE